MKVDLHHSMKVLKSSDKYLIFSSEEVGRKYIYKIARQSNDKLAEEVNRINALRQNYPSMKERLPEIYESGEFKSGIYKGMGFYTQTCFPGMTFSHYIQTNLFEPEKLSKTFQKIITILTDMVAEHHFLPEWDKKSGDFLKQAVQSELNRFTKLKNISYLCELNEIIINGQSYQSFAKTLDIIFHSKIFNDLNAQPSFISALGHWNFHGDNVILGESENIEEFKVIDPDISIGDCDPLFGIARFLYSFPHDTADYIQYINFSKVFLPSAETPVEFRVRSLWPEAVHQNYQRLFCSFYEKDGLVMAEMDSRYKKGHLLNRLKLCFLYCLMRGVSANYREEIEFIDGRITEFRNKSIFLYLQALMFANHLSEEMHA